MANPINNSIIDSTLNIFKAEKIPLYEQSVIATELLRRVHLTALPNLTLDVSTFHLTLNNAVLELIDKDLNDLNDLILKEDSTNE